MAQIAFITGASSGIGAACARKFAQNGYTLLLNARNTEKLQALQEELQAAYDIAVVLLPFDVRDREAAAHALKQLPEPKRASIKRKRKICAYDLHYLSSAIDLILL